MTTEKPSTPEIEVEVFRAGDYGARGNYSEKDLERIAADYAPGSHEAPITIDHKQEGPALGWVRSLRRAGNTLVARIGGLAAEFLEQVRSGAFKKRSIELYRSAEWSGRPYLRAVSFLGACPPAVKGLADPVFAEGDGQTEKTPWVEFEEGAINSPVFEVENTGPSCSPAFQAANVAPVPDAALVSGDDANIPNSTADSVMADGGSFADSATASIASPASKDSDWKISRFCDSLREEGRLLPVWEARGIMRFMQSLDDAAPVRFGEGEDALSRTLRGWFGEFLKSLPPSVPMGEAAGGNDGMAPHSGMPSFNQSRNARIDPESFSLHQHALRFLDANPRATYSEALRAVAGR